LCLPVASNQKLVFVVPVPEVGNQVRVQATEIQGLMWEIQAPDMKEYAGAKEDLHKMIKEED
jgi:hypothetical protein